MALGLIEALLKQRMGLHSATVGSSTVEQAVLRRMRNCKIDDFASYARIVQHSDTELDALIDEVIIPETWFYRDQTPFSAFREWLENEWKAAHALTQLRILSVPCSSGEEAYTLAMCLADCGLPLEAAHIDAVDISSHNLNKALVANYGSNSFRCNDLSFRQRYFDSVGQRYQLREQIRRRVHLARANILDETFVQNRHSYHVIFCRNLLIYFDRPTQELAINRLESLLAPGGLLFLGHSETSLLMHRDFMPLQHPRCFAYRQGKPAFEKQPGTTRTATPPPRYRRTHRSVRHHGTAPFAGVIPVANSAGPTGSARVQSCDALETAFELANQGHLDEAARHCETLIKQAKYQAGAYYLLGLIRQSAGNSGDAESLFRKTIYLEPEHYEALTHLGVLCQQRGDTESARRFQQRAARAQGRNTVHEAKE
jgi:chemotaxis protein methyltransferase WspC